jgi:hypothetical protein
LSHGREAVEPKRRDRRFGTAGDHHVGIAVLDHPARHADAVQAGRASGDDRQVRTLEAEHDRDVPRDHVDDGSRNEEGRDAPWPALLELGFRVFDERQPTYAGADQAADAFGLFLAELVVGRQAGVSNGLDRGDQAIVDEGIHVPRVLGREPVLDLETLDLAGEAAGEGGRVELGDAGDAGTPGEQVLPALGNAVADRADQAEAGDDDATGSHARDESRGSVWLKPPSDASGRNRSRAARS